MAPTQRAIVVHSLMKTYRLYRSKGDRAVEALLPFVRSRHQAHHALFDISFEVLVGECVGIIGRNGSGKSTLLKILTGVLSPTSGAVEVKGKVASLLELGAGFNPELTGRENIFFNATLMGNSREETEAQLEKIISFADIGSFIDQPVKVYSSGMFVRLAFAVSIHVNPDILIVDEALAVGDARFQKKCIDFMRRFKESGGTILFVSHDIFTVKSFCNRLILLHDGKVELQGEPDQVANRYHQIMFPKAIDIQTDGADSSRSLTLQETRSGEEYWLEVNLTDASDQWGSGAAWIKQLRIGGIREPNLFNWQDEVVIEALVQWNPAAVERLIQEHHLPSQLLIGFRFENAQGWVITNFSNSVLTDGSQNFNIQGYSHGVIRCKIDRMKLASGHYFITPGLAIGDKDTLFPVQEYTNLVHLFCDTKEAVLGQLVLDYQMTFEGRT